MTASGLILFAIGALFGTLGDFFHVITGTDGYQNPLLALPTGQPIWVPFLFGSATVAIGLPRPFLDRHLNIKATPPKNWATAISGGLAFLALYAASGFLSLPTGSGRDLALIAGAVLVWLIFDRTWHGIFYGICTATMGTLVEINLTKIGAFYYYPHVANFNGVPSWLPWLYVAASISVGNMGRLMAVNSKNS